MKGFCNLRSNLVVLLFFFFVAPLFSEELKKIKVNGVEIHYIESGKGTPVIFVHGGLVDYRRWSPQIEPVSRQYHVISYSRRYNFPNRNPELPGNHSAIVEAEDLAALIQELKLAPAHIIGESYGAYTAMLLAIQNPELVRTLVLAETPLLDWLIKLEGGRIPYERFMNELWIPIRAALKEDNQDQAIDLIGKYFIGETAQVPEELKSLFRQNLLEWKMLSASSDPFPDLDEATIRKINVPVLMMTGENTLDLFHILEPKVESVLPNVKRVIVPGATHEMWEEYPAECRAIALTFIAQH